MPKFTFNIKESADGRFLAHNQDGSISAESDDLLALRDQLHKAVQNRFGSDIPLEALEYQCEGMSETRSKNCRLLLYLAGIGEGPSDLSTSYKQYIYDYLCEKHGLEK